MIDVHDLTGHPFLDDLDGLVMQRLAAIATEEHVPPGRHLLREGEPANSFVLLRTGDVALELHIPGRGLQRVETLHDGDVIGWSALVPPHRWRFDARVLGGADLLLLDGPSLRELCHTPGFPGPELYARLMTVVVDRLQHTRMRLLDLFGDQHE